MRLFSKFFVLHWKIKKYGVGSFLLKLFLRASKLRLAIFAPELFLLAFSDITVFASAVRTCCVPKFLEHINRFLLKLLDKKLYSMTGIATSFSEWKGMSMLYLFAICVTISLIPS